MKTFITILICLLCVAQADAQSKVKKFFHYIGHETKLTITDIKHDKQWAGMVTLLSASNAADLITTCRSFKQGLVESSFPLSGSTSCPAVVSFGVGAEFVELVATHMITDHLEHVCQQDNNQPEQWKHMTNTKSCREILWLPALIDVPIHSVAAYNNVCLSNGGCVIHNDAFKKIDMMSFGARK
jgi:hypothetical protein